MGIFLKTPITYYGGKQRMLRHILPLIPAHEKYIEPFCGGAAVFFAKHPANLEIINDKNDNVINFYRCCKENMPALKKRIETLIYSRSIYRRCILVNSNPQNYDKIERAAAFFALSAMCVGSVIGSGFSTNINISRSLKPRRLTKKKKMFCEKLSSRFDNTIIENMDAVELLKLYDTPSAFFYIDPPYFNANMGHYAGFTAADFETLLLTLSQIKGKFLLSCYESDLLKNYLENNAWNFKEICAVASATRAIKNRQRTEILVFNYDLSENGVKQLTFF